LDFVFEKLRANEPTEAEKYVPENLDSYEIEVGTTTLIKPKLISLN